jgi:hypothetical protein
VTADPTHPNPFARGLPALLVLLAAALVALTVPATASATTPCARKIIEDWWDNGRIDRLYPLPCYRQAIKAIPPDIRLYGDAQEVIERAMQAALRGKLDKGGPDPSPGGASRHKGGRSPAVSPEQVASTTSGASSMPVALLVLGGLSLALLAAGGLGYVMRRRQAADGEDVDTPGDDDQL